MAYVRTKQIPPGSGNHYRYLEEIYRENGEVRTRHLAYLGTASGPGDKSISAEEVPDDVDVDDVEGLGGTTKETKTKVYDEEYEGEMSEFISENKNVVLESHLNQQHLDMDEEELKEKVKKQAFEQHGKKLDKVYIDRDEEMVYGLSSPYDINTYPEGKSALDYSGKGSPYNTDLANEIHETSNYGIRYTSSMGEKRLIVKERDSKYDEGYRTRKYKVYTYKKEGEQVFIDDEKTPVDKLMKEGL